LGGRFSQNEGQGNIQQIRNDLNTTDDKAGVTDDFSASIEL
jgi:hypothetical protein